MIKLIRSADIHLTESVGSTGRYHFSYGDYHDPAKTCFGVLEALNDFTVEPGGGFTTHPHEEIEIVSYCVAGTLSHSDSVGNNVDLQRGDVGYQCAGSGLLHAELNRSPTDQLRFVQILFTPDRPGLPPAYSFRSFPKMHRRNRWLQIVSRHAANGHLRISQEANIFATEVDKGHSLVFELADGRQSYLVCLEGSSIINGLDLEEGGVAIAWGAVGLHLDALEESHLLLVEMPATS